MSTINSRITPISDGYPTCSECYAQLLIYPGAIHPDDVSKLLGLEPTQKNIAGTVVTNSRGKTREIKLSGWFLSSEQYVQSKDLREHIDWILEKIKPLKEELIKLQNIDGITLGIDCVWRSAVGHGGPTLWPEQMRSISDLDLECSFDIYFDPEGSTSQ